MNTYQKNLDCKRQLNRGTNIRDDCCEMTWRDRSNQLMSNYWLDNPVPCNNNPAFLCEPDLNMQRAPYNCQDFKLSSDLRNGCSGNVLTHDGRRKTLDVRPYRTVPGMTQCLTPLMDSDLYSQMITGESTRMGKGCNSLAGVTVDRFEPLVPCLKYNVQNPVHLIPKYWVRGGMDTRAFIRNADYLRACGIEKCKTPCQSNFCGPQQLSSEMQVSLGQTKNMPCMPGGTQISQF